MKHFLSASVNATIIGSLLVFSSLAQAQSSNNGNEANVGKQDTAHSAADKAASTNPNMGASTATNATTKSKKPGKKKPANNTNCPTDTTKQSGSPDYSGCKQNPEYR
ncbi:hypothetical protein ACO0LO_19155 [Undibacterium sp. TJN25]|uniref:hypothetical protein n=1 Tax=Undibacterium sp. TJN25 TaxID=3413056 RepID=UPI003BF0E677